jgi:hypothetical protein
LQYLRLARCDKAAGIIRLHRSEVFWVEDVLGAQDGKAPMKIVALANVSFYIFGGTDALR